MSAKTSFHWEKVLLGVDFAHEQLEPDMFERRFPLLEESGAGKELDFLHGISRSK